MKFAILLLFCSLSWCAQAGGLELIGRIELPGVVGRFDHFAIDAKGRRLFVAALGNDTLEAIDVATRGRLKSVSGLHKPTGALYLVDSNQVAVAGGDDGTVRLFDAASWKPVKSLGGLDDADNARFDAAAKQVYVGYGDGAIAVIDPATMTRTASIHLAAHPEAFQLEPRGHRIFVNVPDAKQIAVVDREKQIVTATWPMQKFQANFPMALDEADHRLFIGCRSPPRLVIFDTSTGATVGDLAISADIDDLFYDAARKRLYLSCGQGWIDVIDQRDPDHYQLRERIPTRSGARTSFFSADLDAYYVALPQHGERAAEIRIFRPRK
ncbi:MAG: YncE family protein [Terrimicrobiaceae bacterium]|nr:YncE family protein [Terrimicrobiaceae bacterium]